jgi:hypothetical protein
MVLKYWNSTNAKGVQNPREGKREELRTNSAVFSKNPGKEKGRRLPGRME